MSKQALPKAQRTQGLSSLTKVTAFKQHKNSTSNSKLQLQNLDQTRLQNLDLNSISKSRQNFSFKILTKIQLQSLDKTSLSIS